MFLKKRKIIHLHQMNESMLHYRS